MTRPSADDRRPRPASAANLLKRFASRGFLLSSALLAVFLGAFLDFSENFLEPDESEFARITAMDEQVITAVHALRSPLLTQAMLDLSALGSFSVISTLSLLMLHQMVIRRHRQAMLHLLICLAGTGLLPQILKRIFNRMRPDDATALAQATGLSFPSGHAFAASAFYLTAAFFASRYLTRRLDMAVSYFFALLIIGVVSFSRVYLGVHYPTDVLGGVLSGSAWALGVVVFFLAVGKLKAGDQKAIQTAPGAGPPEE